MCQSNIVAFVVAGLLVAAGLALIGVGVFGVRRPEDSARHEEFWTLVQALQETDAVADRLCDEANEDGIENEEFDVREQADDLARAAVGVAEQLLIRSRPPATH